MPLDGIFLSQLKRELQAAVDCHLDKIHQPSRDVLVFLLRKPGFSSKLLLSARPETPRVQFTADTPENPAQPPAFCMRLRKLLGGARITSITQPGFERVLFFEFSAVNEMGDRIAPKLAVELIGRQANLILIGDDGRIIDAVRRSDVETAARMIQPGARYQLPPAQEKVSLLEPAGDLALRLESAPCLTRALLDTFDGLSPLIAREVVWRSCGQGDPAYSELTDAQRQALFLALEDLKESICAGGTPTLLSDQTGRPADFSYYPIGQYGSLYQTQAFGSYSELLEAFYGRRETSDQLRQARSALQRVVNQRIARVQKKMQLRRQDLANCENREGLRICGELLKANLHAVARGAPFVDLPNYYDEELKPLRVRLNPALSPAANAAKYFKDYKKTYTAEETLTRLIAQDETELSYLESVLDALSRADSIADLNEIREELLAGAYLRRQEKNAKRAPVTSKPLSYTSSEGFRILVGRNNRQNDVLTLQTAAKNDLWFHTKNIPGSHVIVVCDGKTPGEQTILEAAALAAYHSKARLSSQVPVDYTPVKFVKKPSGAKPGMVIYTTNQTAFVTPSELPVRSQAER